MNLAGVRSAQPVPASLRPPRAAHGPAAARAPRTMFGRNDLILAHDPARASRQKGGAFVETNIL